MQTHDGGYKVSVPKNNNSSSKKKPIKPECLLPVPNLRQEIRHVDLLVLHLHYPWMIQHPPRTRSPRRVFLKTVKVSENGNQGYFRIGLPARDKVLEIVAPFDAKLRLVLQLRNWLPHDVREQVN
jgi:hypothetical protein